MRPQLKRDSLGGTANGPPMPDFVPLFRANGGRPIEFDGQLLHWTLQLELPPATRLHIDFVSSVSRPVQGLSVSAAREKHRLTAAGVSARHLVLWRDTAPPHVEVILPPARRPVPVLLHNVWRDEKYGTTMYRLNAAAMRVTQEPQRWLLECSDGWGTEPDFHDLVCRLTVDTGASGAA